MSVMLAPAPPPDVVSRARYERERRAREEAERLLEDKSRSLFEANQKLRRQADLLEAEVRRRTADLEAARAAADAASNAKSTFLAVMSHEIRTPMNGVLGMAAALAQTDLAPDQVRMLEVIEASGQLLLGIIDDILDLSKIEAGKLTLDEAPFDLAAALAQPALLFRQSAQEKGLSLQVDIATDLSLQVTGDAMRLGQVLNNLMSNAVKFTDRGEVTLAACRRDGMVEVTVSDTGIGIPEDARSRLFQPFAQVEGTASQRHKGTGLGLSISRQLAEMMGGSLVLLPGAGQGTAFLLRLPLRAAPAADASGAAPVLSPSERLDRLRPRILAIDDNATNRLVLRHLLARGPVELTLAESAGEGLALAEEAPFDAVLMDIQMPDMDGIAAIAELRRREAAAGRRPVPVLAVSANAMADQVAGYLAAGFAGHVAKPVRTETLVAAIVAAIDAPASPPTDGGSEFRPCLWCDIVLFSPISHHMEPVMTLSRRKTLALIGGGAIVAASAGAGFAVTRTPRTAHLPWQLAGTYDEPRRRALSWALLAPSPHNQQPWLADLSEEGVVTLHADPGRLLPHTDPMSRQITIGLGGFLEILRMAAAEDGYRLDLALFPDGEDPQALDDRPIARAVFVPDPGVAKDPLFAQVPHRRSLKEPYDLARPVSEDVLVTLRAAATTTVVDTTADPARVQEMRDISTEAFVIEFGTPRTMKESVDLFRIGAREVDANPDGLDFSGPMFETLRLAGLFTRDGSLDPNGFSARSALDMITRNMQTGMAHLWQVTPTNTRADQIRAGQDWVRINLKATELGIGVQPLSQALQEFPEMAPLYSRVHEMLAPGGGTVQMWARLGYGPTVGPSPRWPLDAKIVGT